MSTLLLLAVAAIGSLLVALIAGVSLRLLVGNRREASKNAARVGGVRAALNGQALVREDWLPDARVSEGMVYNADAHRIEINGRISDEALRKSLQPS